MNPLKNFHSDVHTREAVHAFMLEFLREKAVDKVFSKQAIAGVYEAKKIIDEAFNKLEEMFAEKKAPVIESSR